MHLHFTQTHTLVPCLSALTLHTNPHTDAWSQSTYTSQKQYTDAMSQCSHTSFQLLSYNDIFALGFALNITLSCSISNSLSQHQLIMFTLLHSPHFVYLFNQPGTTTSCRRLAKANACDISSAKLQVALQSKPTQNPHSHVSGHLYFTKLTH